jgi:hypothetical protein
MAATRIDAMPLADATSTGADEAMLGPEHFSPSLAGCRWTSAANSQAFGVEDEHGVVLGIGQTRRTAALLAQRVRQAAPMLPEAYYPCLKGCRFATKPHRGDSISWTTVEDSSGHQIAYAPTKADAALTAARNMLRAQRPELLAVEDFRRICTVITVEEARGKTGKAKTGEPYLRLEYRTDPDAGARMRALLMRIVDESGLDGGAGATDGLPAAQAYDARAAAATRFGENLLDDNYFDGGVGAVSLPNGEWLVLRKPDAPPPRQCVQDTHDAILDGEYDDQDDSAAYERPRMR